VTSRMPLDTPIRERRDVMTGRGTIWTGTRLMPCRALWLRGSRSSRRLIKEQEHRFWSLGGSAFGPRARPLSGGVQSTLSYKRPGANLTDANLAAAFSEPNSLVEHHVLSRETSFHQC
jgi:hypothetical protein